MRTDISEWINILNFSISLFLLRLNKYFYLSYNVVTRKQENYSQKSDLNATPSSQLRAFENDHLSVDPH